VNGIQGFRTPTQAERLRGERREFRYRRFSSSISMSRRGVEEHAPRLSRVPWRCQASAILSTTISVAF
jgi:hypothetical protein